MYSIKLTNEKTNVQVNVILPVTNLEKWSAFTAATRSNIDYTVADELVNALYDTDNYSAWVRFMPGYIATPWDYPTARILGEFGYNQLSTFKYLAMTASEVVMAGGMWKTESGKLIEFSKDGSAVVRDLDAHTSEHYNKEWTWIERSPSASGGLWFIRHISDEEAFFRSEAENIERSEGSGWGDIYFLRPDSIIENRIDVIANSYQYNADYSYPHKSNLLWWKLFTTEKVYKDEELTKDPYKAPYSTGGVGGNGRWYDRDDIIAEPPLPNVDATSTGMITIFNPTINQLTNLASYLWSGNIEDIISKMWADPMDVMLGLSVVGCPVSSSTTKTVSVAGRSTGVSMNVAASQYVNVDCGTVTLEEYFGSYMDYAPYTKISIFLPFIGSKELDTDIVMNKTIRVKYHCDILTGSCVAYIFVNGNIKYQFNGNVSTLMPFTSANFSRMISSAFGLVTDVANVAGGSINGVAGGVSGAIADMENSKPQIHRSGNIGSTTGLLSVRIPYLIIERPNLCLPESQNRYLGYPSFTTATVGDLVGYTEFDDVRADGLTCTKEEQEAIITKLKQGVII